MESPVSATHSVQQAVCVHVCVCVCVCVKEGIFIKSLKFHSIAINKYGTRPPSHSL